MAGVCLARAAGGAPTGWTGGGLRLFAAADSATVDRTGASRRRPPPARDCELCVTPAFCCSAPMEGAFQVHESSNRLSRTTMEHINEQCSLQNTKYSTIEGRGARCTFRRRFACGSALSALRCCAFAIIAASPSIGHPFSMQHSCLSSASPTLPSSGIAATFLCKRAKAGA